MFMAIVIPVALQGLSIASRAGEVAERKREAVRVAERVLNETVATTNWNQSAQSGVIQELDREYRWTLRNGRWTESTMQLLTVEVTFPVAVAASAPLGAGGHRGHRAWHVYNRPAEPNRDGRFDTERRPVHPFSMQLCTPWMARVERADGMTLGELPSDEKDGDVIATAVSTQSDGQSIPFRHGCGVWTIYCS